MYDEPRRLPSLKRFLIRIRLDLDRLIKYREYHWDEQLTLFEQLVIVLEDRRFLRHHGIDWPSVARVVLKGALLRGKGGASTIEMQYVRTITGRYERTLGRKFYEILLAWLLDFQMDKPDILASYLAHAYFGTRLIGAESAAAAMFGVRVNDLNVDQVADLAAMLVYPLPRNPSESWRRKIARRSAYGVRLWKLLKERLNKSPVR